MVANEKMTIKMVDDLACEVISTGTVKITERDVIVCALEAVQYVPKARYNLISIKVLERRMSCPSSTRHRRS